MKQSLEKSYARLRDYDSRVWRHQQIDANKQFHSSKQKMLTAICYKMEVEGKFRETPPQNLQGAASLHKFMQGRIAQDELVKDLRAVNLYGGGEDDHEESQKQRERQKEQAKNWHNSLVSMAEPKRCLNSKFYQSVKRHHYHPPSKLFFIEDERAAAAAADTLTHDFAHEISKR